MTPAENSARIALANMRAKYRDVARQLADARRRHDEAVDKATALMRQGRIIGEYQALIAQVPILREKIPPLEAQLEAISAEHDAKREDARRAGMKAVVWRDSI